MPEALSGTADQQPADDIRSTLAAAISAAEAADAPDPVETPEPVAEKPAVERERGPDGKFVKKEGEDEPVAEEAAAEPVVEEPTEEKSEQQASATEPPTHWSQADKDIFKKQPAEAQKFLLDRHKAMEADYTKKTQAVAAFRNEYEPVAKMFEPHAATLKAKGFTPRSLIEAWANVETKLAGGPDSAVDVIKGLVSGYNIPAAKIAAALGLTNAPAPAADPVAIENGQQVALPPEVAAELKSLRDQVGGIANWKSTQEQRDAAAERSRQMAEEQRVQNEVETFRSSKDDKGNLLHPYMGDVEEVMTLLANGYVASKQAVPSLKELYETAVNAHPPTREKLVTAARQADEQRKRDEARAKAAAAKKAGSSVNGAPGAGQAPNPNAKSDLSLREQLEEAANEAA